MYIIVIIENQINKDNKYSIYKNLTCLLKRGLKYKLY